ncbi:hypothetical protein D3C76_1041160 [compost metagenome]
MSQQCEQRDRKNDDPEGDGTLFHLRLGKFKGQFQIDEKAACRAIPRHPGLIGECLCKALKHVIALACIGRHASGVQLHQGKLVIQQQTADDRLAQRRCMHAHQAFAFTQSGRPLGCMNALRCNHIAHAQAGEDRFCKRAKIKDPLAVECLHRRQPIAFVPEVTVGIVFQHIEIARPGDVQHGLPGIEGQAVGSRITEVRNGINRPHLTPLTLHGADEMAQRARVEKSGHGYGNNLDLQQFGNPGYAGKHRVRHQ